MYLCSRPGRGGIFGIGIGIGIGIGT